MMVSNAADGGKSAMTPDENCGMRLEFKSLTMSGLADTLSPLLDRPVIDGTGIKGSYQASLKLPMELMFSMMQNTIRNANLPPPPGDWARRSRSGLLGVVPAAAWPDLEGCDQARL